VFDARAVARFQQQISDEDVVAAREKIARGASLRSAAADIPCAPSTLSVRIKKAKAAEAASTPATGDDDGGRDADGTSEHADARGSAAATSAGPVETLRGALQATKASGQPDWPTRVAAARALAALRPEELEPHRDPQPLEPSIVVYDLAPGSPPVLHRPAKDADAAPSHDQAPAAQQQSAPPAVHMFRYQPRDGDSVGIGSWTDPNPDHARVVSLASHDTDDLETADRWRAELSAGRLPDTSETP
jgi:hypothetical protein